MTASTTLVWIVAVGRRVHDEVLDDLLGDRGAALLDRTRGDVGQQGPHDAAPVDAVVLPEIRILHREDRRDHRLGHSVQRERLPVLDLEDVGDVQAGAVVDDRPPSLGDDGRHRQRHLFVGSRIRLTSGAAATTTPVTPIDAAARTARKRTNRNTSTQATGRAPWRAVTLGSNRPRSHPSLTSAAVTDAASRPRPFRFGVQASNAPTGPEWTRLAAPGRRRRLQHALHAGPLR